MGFNIAAIYLGTTIGPVLGAVIITFVPWRYIFFINIPIGIVVIILGWSQLKSSEMLHKTQIFDIKGTIVFGACLFSLLLGLSIGNTIGWLNPLILIFFILAGIFLIVFLLIETKAAAPMINLKLLRHNRNFVAGNATALLNYIALNGNLFILSIYLQSFLGLPVMIAGLLILPTPLTQSIVSLRSGRLSDKIGTRKLVAMGMGLIGLGFVFAIFIVQYLTIEWFFVSQFIIGFGVGLFSSPNQSAILGSVEKKDLGIASGMLSTMRTTGQSISIALLSAIVGLFIAPSLLNKAIETQAGLNVTALELTQFRLGMTIAFFVSTCLCILGIFTALVQTKKVLNLPQHEEAPVELPKD
jgi:MFS family permease